MLGYKMFLPRWHTIMLYIWIVIITIKGTNGFTVSNTQLINPNAMSMCIHNGTRFGEGSFVPTVEPCLNCKCTNKTLICALRVCPEQPIPPPRGCILIQRSTSCCAYLSCSKYNLATNNNDHKRIVIKFLDDMQNTRNHYKTDIQQVKGDNLLFRRSNDADINSKVCIENGTIYKSGSAMSTSSICIYCYCIEGRQKCVKPKCILPSPRCKPIFIDSACCPIRYDCTGKVSSFSSFKTSATNSLNNLGNIENKHYLRNTTRIRRSRGCYIDTQFYSEGQKMPSKNNDTCDVCFCIRGVQKCTHKVCTPTIRNCVPIIPAGQCCPSSYDCNTSSERSISVESNRQFDLLSILFGFDDESINLNDTNESSIDYPTISPEIMNTALMTDDNFTTEIKPTQKSLFEVIREGLDLINDSADADNLDSEIVPTNADDLIPFIPIKADISNLTDHNIKKIAEIDYDFPKDRDIVDVSSSNSSSIEESIEIYDLPMHKNIAVKTALEKSTEEEEILETEEEVPINILMQSELKPNETKLNLKNITLINDNIEVATVSYNMITPISMSTLTPKTTIKATGPAKLKTSTPTPITTTTHINLGSNKSTKTTIKPKTTLSEVEKVELKIQQINKNKTNKDVKEATTESNVKPSTIQLNTETKKIIKEKEKQSLEAKIDVILKKQETLLKTEQPNDSNYNNTEISSDEDLNIYLKEYTERNATTETSFLSAFFSGFASIFDEDKNNTLSEQMATNLSNVKVENVTEKVTLITTTLAPISTVKKESNSTTKIMTTAKPSVVKQQPVTFETSTSVPRKNITKPTLATQIVSTVSTLITLPQSTTSRKTTKKPTTKTTTPEATTKEATTTETTSTLLTTTVNYTKNSNKTEIPKIANTEKPEIKITTPQSSDINQIKMQVSINPVIIKTNPTIFEQDYHYSDYNDPTLPPSLPNLKIIPFLPTDALKNDRPKINYADYYNSFSSTVYPGTVSEKHKVYNGIGNIGDLQKEPTSTFSATDKYDTFTSLKKNNYNLFNINPTSYPNEKYYGVNAESLGDLVELNPKTNNRPNYDIFDDSLSYITGSYESENNPTVYPDIPNHYAGIDESKIIKDKLGMDYDYHVNYDVKYDQNYHNNNYGTNKYNTDFPTLNYDTLSRFSPPTKTEGGFVPRKPESENHFYYDSYHTTFFNFELTTESNSRGNNSSEESIDLFKDVIQTEKAPDFNSLIEDKEKYLFNIFSNNSEGDEVISITTDSSYNQTSEYIKFNDDLHLVQRNQSILPVNNTKPVTNQTHSESLISSTKSASKIISQKNVTKVSEALNEKPTKNRITSSVEPDKKKSSIETIQNSSNHTKLNEAKVTEVKKNNTLHLEITHHKNQSLLHDNRTTGKNHSSSFNASNNLNPIFISQKDANKSMTEVNITNTLSPGIHLDPHEIVSEITDSYNYNPIRSDLDLIIPEFNHDAYLSQIGIDSRNRNPDYQSIPAEDDIDITNTESYVINPVDVNSLKIFQKSNESDTNKKPWSSLNNPIGNILKLAGCNIYGRMYRVGRIISELSGPCIECKCTEVGVNCTPLNC